MQNNLTLILFEHNVYKAKEALNYGINHFLVDWEDKGKHSRQKGYDTEINTGNVKDLRQLSVLDNAIVWCRINRFGTWTKEEVEQAIDAGATGIFLPMVTTVDEVKLFLSYIANRCKKAILIETIEASLLVNELAQLPLDKIYFGLNDFTISRKDSFLFQAIYDGTIEKVRNKIKSPIEFGFGGATDIHAGTPIPSKYLLQEIARLDCSFTFLRRSFKSDIKKVSPQKIVKEIYEHWNILCLRKKEEIDKDYKHFKELLEPLC